MNAIEKENPNIEEDLEIVKNIIQTGKEKKANLSFDEEGIEELSPNEEYYQALARIGLL